jgi:membrane-bound serine protease (ClpP class)
MLKIRKIITLISSVLLASFLLGVEVEENSTQNLQDISLSPNVQKIAFQIPIRDQIGPPILDILRRGLKSAIEANADILVIDMDTPGGELGVTLEIMQEIIESFDRFEGPIITYVNNEAISAGAYIAIATNEIAFAPFAQIGAAEAVSGGGGNIDSSMKRKVNSYLKAKIRSYTGKYRYRSRVMASMMDSNETLLIEGSPPLAADGSVIQKEGELVTLTAEEAIKEYGTPPQPLLGIGIYDSVEKLLDEKWGEGNYNLIKMEINWAERAGLWLNSVGPIIIGIGLLGLFIEFKTPGFGFFGIAGIIFVLIFFGSKYVSGLAGQEEVIIFLIGVSLVILELFLFPGLIVPAVLGMLMIFGSILWAMVDVWPNTDLVWSIELFRQPIMDLFWAILIAFGLALILTRILPHTSMWNKLILAETVGGLGVTSISAMNKKQTVKNGSIGLSVSELYPTGQVKIDGIRYDARSSLGKIEKGTKVEVTGSHDFELTVRKL